MKYTPLIPYSPLAGLLAIPLHLNSVPLSPNTPNATLGKEKHILLHIFCDISGPNNKTHSTNSGSKLGRERKEICLDTPGRDFTQNSITILFTHLMR